ncbi:MAG: MBL fold metallo-hydrolase [Candidatus Promineifilaceae bacterium]
MDLLDGRVSTVVLGIAQDAGVPHAGCCCSMCLAAFSDIKFSHLSTSIAIVDARQNPPRTWLIDATPDIKHQINLLRDTLGAHPSRPDRLQQPDGLFITHGHMGHSAGLVHLGPEGMAVRRMRVYASIGIIAALKETRLWSPLLDNLELIPLKPNIALEMAPGLFITPLPVPHRDEIGAGTFAYQIDGEAKSLLYVPDIDSWALWPEAKRILGMVDVALVDATFYSRDEISGRDSVSHPLVSETLAFFRDIPTRLILTHLNHTNPLLYSGSKERQFVESQGVEVAARGQRFIL